MRWSLVLPLLRPIRVFIESHTGESNEGFSRASCWVYEDLKPPRQACTSR